MPIEVGAAPTALGQCWEFVRPGLKAQTASSKNIFKTSLQNCRFLRPAGRQFILREGMRVDLETLEVEKNSRWKPLELFSLPRKGWLRPGSIRIGQQQIPDANR
jgi:hypothetical protein